jgi:hypothetical protein
MRRIDPSPTPHAPGGEPERPSREVLGRPARGRVRQVQEPDPLAEEHGKGAAAVRVVGQDDAEHGIRLERTPEHAGERVGVLACDEPDRVLLQGSRHHGIVVRPRIAHHARREGVVARVRSPRRDVPLLPIACGSRTGLLLGERGAVDATESPSSMRSRRPRSARAPRGSMCHRRASVPTRGAPSSISFQSHVSSTVSIRPPRASATSGTSIVRRRIRRS